MQTRLRKKKEERIVEKYVKKRGLMDGSLGGGGHFHPITGVPGLFAVEDICREFGDLLRSEFCYTRSGIMWVSF